MDASNTTNYVTKYDSRVQSKLYQVVNVQVLHCVSKSRVVQSLRSSRWAVTRWQRSSTPCTYGCTYKKQTVFVFVFKAFDLGLICQR